MQWVIMVASFLKCSVVNSWQVCKDQQPELHHTWKIHVSSPFGINYMNSAADLLPCLALWAHSHSYRRFCSGSPPILSSLHAVEGFPSAKSRLLPRVIKAHSRASDLIAENKALHFKFTLFCPLLFSNSPRRTGGSVGRQSVSLLVAVRLCWVSLPAHEHQ